ncbi:unnamed protein product [Caenorhabditis angaria]|uniref:Major facilitator superfamily (MFS) profile domain-containing protein n=1 Tax=Caenorhabditis angaria TaxID=860376 RepID=A0A9P1IN01_9PELO|nr:unnamed protein product [Caenorhabditis angaria]
MGRWQTVRLLIIYSILSAITNFPSGFTNSTVNTAVAKLHKFIVTSLQLRGYSDDDNTVALIQSATLNCWFVAQIFGALLTPTISDRFGRRAGYIICVCVTIIATLIQYLSIITYMPWTLILGRSLTALVSPLGDACLLLYVQETSPVEIRGMSSFLCEIGYGSMCVLGMILGMKSVLGASLSNLLLVSLLPLCFSLGFVLQLPETPKFLMIVKGDSDRAMKSLRYFQGRSNSNYHLLSEYQAEKMTEQDQKDSSFLDLISKWHLRQAMKLALATLALTLSFYPILQSSTLFLAKSGVPMETAQWCSTFAQIVLTLSSIFGASIIDHFPRRALILTFGVLSNLLLLSFAIFSTLSTGSDNTGWTKYACLASLVAYCISFGMVLGPLSWFVAPELVSQRHRCTIFSACFAIHNLLIALTDFATIPLFMMYGSQCFIYLFIIPSSICLIYLYIYMPETWQSSTLEIINDMIERGLHGRNIDHFDLDTPSFQVRPRLFSINSASCSPGVVMVY